MSHTHPEIIALDSHPSRTPGGLNTATIAVVGAVGVILIAVIGIAAEAWYQKLYDAQVAEQWVEPNAEVLKFKEAQLAQLHQTGTRINPETKAAVNVIPIDRAMEIVAQSHAKK